jgi:UDP-glucose 4-epimerase
MISTNINVYYKVNIIYVNVIMDSVLSKQMQAYIFISACSKMKVSITEALKQGAEGTSLGKKAFITAKIIRLTQANRCDINICKLPVK